MAKGGQVTASETRRRWQREFESYDVGNWWRGDTHRYPAFIKVIDAPYEN